MTSSEPIKGLPLRIGALKPPSHPGHNVAGLRGPRTARRWGSVGGNDSGKTLSLGWVATGDEANPKSVLPVSKASKPLQPALENLDGWGGILELKSNARLLIKIGSHKEHRLPPSGGIPEALINEVINADWFFAHGEGRCSWANVKGRATTGAEENL